MTFAAETAAGWQQAMFPTPIPVTGGTSYVLVPRATGHYAYDSGYFSGSGRTYGPLTAPAKLRAGGNGV